MKVLQLFRTENETSLNQKSLIVLGSAALFGGLLFVGFTGLMGFVSTFGWHFFLDKPLDFVELKAYTFLLLKLGLLSELQLPKLQALYEGAPFAVVMIVGLANLSVGALLSVVFIKLLKALKSVKENDYFHPENSQRFQFLYFYLFSYGDMRL